MPTGDVPESATTTKFSFTRKEVIVLIAGTCLALGSLKADDPVIVAPMLVVSWIAFGYACLAHEGSFKNRLLVFLVITFVLAGVGDRLLANISKTDIHPVITQTKSQVGWNSDWKFVIVVTLRNQSDYETTANISTVLSWGGHAANHDMTFAFGPREGTDITERMVFNDASRQNFTNSKEPAIYKLKAEYPDRGKRTTLVFEGLATAQSDHINITKSTWEHNWLTPRAVSKGC